MQIIILCISLLYLNRSMHSLITSLEKYSGCKHIQKLETYPNMLMLVLKEEYRNMDLVFIPAVYCNIR